jgi:hypothetical protein
VWEVEGVAGLVDQGLEDQPVLLVVGVIEGAAGPAPDGVLGDGEALAEERVADLPPTPVEHRPVVARVVVGVPEARHDHPIEVPLEPVGEAIEPGLHQVVQLRLGPVVPRIGAVRVVEDVVVGDGEVDP